MYNGIIVIDKDAGMTSGDVVYNLRKILHTRKIGHAGTLDPSVTGVLPIAVGQATKLIELMHERPKAYEGEGMFGEATDSYDLDGTVTKTARLARPFTSAEIQAGMKQLTGDISQLPPIYSAVKVNGKRLYEYARAGIPVERPARAVHVASYELVGKPKWDEAQARESFAFKVACSKGTYVRSLVNDLGEKMGVPAVMTRLRRTASSGFDLQQAVTLDELEKHLEQIDQYLQPIDAFFKDYQTVDLDEQSWKQVQNGAWIKLKADADKVALRYNNRVKAIYRAKGGATYCPDLMLLSNE